MITTKKKAIIYAVPKILTHNHIHLAVIGDLLEDVFVSLSQPVRNTTDTPVHITRRRGGAAATTAIVAAQKGLRVRFIGCIGTDARGSQFVRELKKHGVQVFLRRRGQTGTIIVLVHQDGERTMLSERAASALLTDPDPSWVENISSLHCSLYAFAHDEMANAMCMLINHARKHQTIISLDVASCGLMEDIGSKNLSTLLNKIHPDIIFANKDESHYVRTTSARIKIIKQGANPAQLYQNNILVDEFPIPYELTIKNSTGAGDAFAAGFFAARQRGNSLQDAIKEAHHTAAWYLKGNNE